MQPCERGAKTRRGDHVCGTLPASAEDVAAARPGVTFLTVGSWVNTCEPEPVDVHVASAGGASARKEAAGALQRLEGVEVAPEGRPSARWRLKQAKGTTGLRCGPPTRKNVKAFDVAFGTAGTVDSLGTLTWCEAAQGSRHWVEANCCHNACAFDRLGKHARKTADARGLRCLFIQFVDLEWLALVAVIMSATQQLETRKTARICAIGCQAEGQCA
eukprot:354208-Chlamydomonas_euryale.AAC.14